MKPALIKLFKRIVLNNSTKHLTLRKIYSDSANITANLLDSFSMETWEEALAIEHVAEHIHTELNSDVNIFLKRIDKNYNDLTIGPNNSIVKVHGAKIEILKGNVESKQSFEFALFLIMEEFTLLNCFGNSILVSMGNQIENLSKGVNTFLLQLDGEYNIIYYQSS